MHPVHARLLIGAQGSLQGRAGIGVGAIRSTQRLQRLGQPGTGGHLRPVGNPGILIGSGNRSTGQEAHGLDEGQAVTFSQSLRVLELPHRAFKTAAIDLDPLTAQQHQRVGAGEQPGDFLVAERFAVERHGHVEIEQSVETDARRRAGANRRRDQWARRTAGAP